MIPLTTQQNRGTVRHGDFYPGSVAVIDVDPSIQEE
jgi:hypothetical protein